MLPAAEQHRQTDFCQGGVDFWRVSAGRVGVFMLPAMQMAGRVTLKAAGGSPLSGFPGHMHRQAPLLEEWENFWTKELGFQVHFLSEV